jgi:hypothetical protein
MTTNSKEKSVFMLWYDPSKEPIEKRIYQGASYYWMKYGNGNYPNIVRANRSTLADFINLNGPVKIGEFRLSVVEDNTVQPNYFLFGITTL